MLLYDSDDFDVIRWFRRFSMIPMFLHSSMFLYDFVISIYVFRPTDLIVLGSKNLS